MRGRKRTRNPPRIHWYINEDEHVLVVGHVGRQLLVRTLDSPHEHTHTPVAPTPEDILRERLARGEIDEEEYRRRLTALHPGPLTRT